MLTKKTKAALQIKRSWDFPEAGVKFSNEFSGARLNDCEQLGPAEFRLVISPENTPINPSPWYAFQVTSSKKQVLTLRFTLTFKGTVLHPRVSRDGKTWTLLANEDFTVTPKSGEVETFPAEKAVARIESGPEPLWVAAQEMIGLAELGAWMDAKARLPFARESTIGRSIGDRPLRQFIFGETERADYVFIIARQHPQEVTGSLGMMRFVDTITGDTDLARRYRHRFQTVVIPLVNPDGIEHGHWRHNLGGTDTNRDWKPFTQPETRAVRDALLALGKAPGAKPFLFLDFHSTGGNVFYGQPDSEPTFPAKFSTRWLGAIEKRFPDYQFKRDDDHNTGVPTSKEWVHHTFGIAGITYEIGYTTDRDLIQKVSEGAAEEMMQLLLAEAEKESR